MPGRALRATSRIAFLLCGLISLFTGVPYAMLQGVGLPVQSEWVIFVVALAVIGVFSVTLGVLPRSWIAKACRKDSDDQRLFSVLLKVLAIFAGVFYLVAVFAYFSPNRWNLNPQLMLALCPMYLVKMTFRSLAGGHLFPACSHERSGVRLTRPYLGIHVAVFSWTKTKSRPLIESRGKRSSSEQ